MRKHLHAGHFLISAGLAAGLFLTQAALAQGLNDSGQTLCYNGTTLVACTDANTGDIAPYPRQDARYGRDAAATATALTKIGGGAAGFDFTKIANDGSELPETATLGTGATDWACARDNVTGLIWEVKVNDNTQLRHQGHTYTWYQADPFPNGGFAGDVGSNTCGGTLSAYSDQCNTANYAAAVNAAPGLCGFTDWRLPSIRELQTLVHYGAVNPVIDPTYFPNTPASAFWSASSYGPNPADAWYVYFFGGFFGGSVNAVAKTVDDRVRLVRGGQF